MVLTQVLGKVCSSYVQRDPYYTITLKSKQQQSAKIILVYLQCENNGLFSIVPCKDSLLFILVYSSSN